MRGRAREIGGVGYQVAMGIDRGGMADRPVR